MVGDLGAGGRAYKDFHEESFNVIHLAARLSDCIGNMTALFGPRRECLTRSFGYTRLMIEELKRPVAWLGDGTLKTLGSVDGPSDAIIDDALDLMKGFLRVFLSELHAEFPSFEVSQAMGIFNLGADATSTRFREVELETHIRRLAALIGKGDDWAQLRDVYKIVLPRVKKLQEKFRSMIFILEAGTLAPMLQTISDVLGHPDHKPK